MFNFQVAQKREKQAHEHNLTKRKEKQRLRRYKTEIKPKLLEHYDARLKAFIRQIEQEPIDPSIILKSKTVAHNPPFKFKLYEPSTLKNKSSHHDSVKELQQNCSILRSSIYCPISQYQYREREKQKQIKAKVKMKTLIYIKRQKQKYLNSIEQIKRPTTIRTNRLSTGQGRKRSPDDNRSQIPSMYGDSQSLRYSNNQNLERQAREFEKRQELVERKMHYKKLANLAQTIQDPHSKKVINDLLVKKGQARARVKSQYDEVEVDFFKVEMEKPSK